ncbi:probable ATP-dependent RNA helicase spindle-E [Onthophagus taurus]|uniref:probable ATP-dependent RNA helicase spindle-E n=1 Tax=Onthophagus taurus TaxID=166361 RepID=UPI000C20020E|nr:probable ATP-dependent RNA helicase spindle-E [Onthophagus taurus]
MDLLRNLLDSKPIVVPMGVVNGRIQHSITNDDQSSEEEQQEDEQAYIEEYKKQEEALYAANHLNYGGLSDIDDEPAGASVNQTKSDLVHEIFQKYPFIPKNDSSLPISHYKSEIIDYLNNNEILIIHGPTGCGKTTQVPQYILDHCQRKNEYCNIVVTQPRRIAAISVARRVCDERGWPLGAICGYQVGLEKQRGADTILSYVTTGVLLQALVKAKNLHNYTHIIIDEVHERSQEMDFLLLLIRKYLYTNSFKVKVILMSATFDTIKFRDYFKHTVGGETTQYPMLHITEKSKYDTQIYYVDQFELLHQVPSMNIDDPKIHPNLYQMLVPLIRIFDKLDRDGNIGSVLVFLPGILEIETAYSHLTDPKLQVHTMASETQWYILPLHSSITNEEQRKVFIPANPGYRKIILSTNIAESSITVPDVAYVIDFCLTKTMVVNPITKYESLQLQWASHINCTQRTGRVGRVNDGRVYRFVSRNFYDTYLSKEIIPEMLRAPLDRIVLSSKLLELNDPPKAILALAIDPPNLSNIQTTIWYLKEVGALALTCRGVSTNCDGDLTYLGNVMANLPLCVNLSKLIFLGHMFSCLTDCIVMAAGCSLSNIFSTPFHEKLSAYQNILQWADGSSSDLIAYLNLYKVWDMKRKSNAFNHANSEKSWAKSNYINLRSLREWSILVDEITKRCAQMGIMEPIGERTNVISSRENALFLKVCMAGAFYPNYFKKPALNGNERETQAVRLLGGKDPFKTVYFTNMDKTQPGPLYARRIKELFKFCKGTTDVSFDQSYRVYVQFNLPTTNEMDYGGKDPIASMPGKICKEVYCAVKRRQLRMSNEIRCLPAVESWKRAKELGITESSGICSLVKKASTGETISVLPSLGIQYIKITITMFIDAGHFWAHNVDNQTAAELQNIHKLLNEMELEPITNKSQLNTTDLFACQYDDECFYRCRITSNTYYLNDSNNNIQVLFVDYGDIRLVNWNKLRFLPFDAKTQPPQAMECILAGIQPSIILSPRAVWSTRANQASERFLKDVEVYAKVYSVVSGIVHLELYRNLPNEDNIGSSFNDWLIRNHYAMKAEESYLSKENHAKRELMQKEDNCYHFEEPIYEEAQVIDVEPPPLANCTRHFQLRGPFSPLEYTIYPMCRDSRENITIEGSSVNSVMLDTDPQDVHDRLIVSVAVGENTTSTNLSLRHTTIMPNILGFPMLMAVLFCPKMEPKPCNDGTQFGAVLCGLGANKLSGKALFPEHDIEVILDAELSQDLLTEINEMRYWMNMAVKTIESIGKKMPPSVDIILCQRNLKSKLENILKHPKEAIVQKPITHSKEWGKFSYTGEILEVSAKNLLHNDIWPMHWTMELKDMDKKNVEVSQNIEDLKSFAKGYITPKEIECQACGVIMYSSPEVGMHLISESHGKIIKRLGL